MADNYLITGYWGEPHVTAENDRGIHAGIFGAGRFVLPVGEQFKAEYIGNNTVRMYDGKLMDNGAAAGIPAGKYIDLLISSAGQGRKRNDLIVFQYSLDSSTLIESGTFIVIPGVETDGTPTDPAVTQEDLLSGKATLDPIPMWRVSVSGLTIAAPEKLFNVTDNLPTSNEIAKNALSVANEAKKAAGNANTAAGNVQTNLDTHAGKTDNPHSVTKAQVGLGNVPNVATNDQTPTFTEGTSLSKLTSGEKLSIAFGKIAKAITDLISHIGNKSNPHGVTAAQVGADASGTAASAVATHNTATSAHNDIRLLIEGLTTRLNALADSDDTTLDQMSELVAYIKSNKALIDSITTSKVNVSDIINNLTTNVSNKPLSAAQGVAIKALIDALQTAVNGKAASTHSHTKSEITDFPTTEPWTFTLEDGSTVTKAVYVG